MITDLGHAAFAAHDLDRALAFYAQLGIRESFRLHRPDGSLMLIYLHIAGDRFIEVFPGGPPPDPDRKGSFMQLCLLTDDLHTTVEQLRASGVAIDREPKQGLDHNWQAWISDPDGNRSSLCSWPRTRRSGVWRARPRHWRRARPSSAGLWTP